MVNLDTCTILVGNGPPKPNKIQSGFIWGKKGNIYFGYGSPKKILLVKNEITPNIDDAQDIASAKPNDCNKIKNTKAKFAQKARLIGKLVAAVKPDEDQYKQIFDTACLFSDNESEASARLYSRCNSGTYNPPAPSGIRLFMTKNRKYNEIITSHARISQALDNIDKEINELVKNSDYINKTVHDTHVLRSPFTNEFQGSFMDDHKARVPRALWIDYIRLGNSN